MVFDLPLPEETVIGNELLRRNLKSGLEVTLKRWQVVVWN